MYGLMQKHQMNLIDILTFAAQQHQSAKISSKLSQDTVHQYGYADALGRVHQLAQALASLGVTQGQTVATMAWNNHRHFEAWYAIAGMGAVCHTTNPRLFADQLSYILNTGGAKVLLVETSFAPIIASLLPTLEHIEHLVWLDTPEQAPQLDTNIRQHSYESLLAQQSGTYDWPALSEDTASSMCFTSGTTGMPKGVVYSHRSNMLMAMMTKAADGLNINHDDSVLMVVPMFHANSWGLVYSAPMVGADLVLPGPFLDGQSLHTLIHNHGVTFSAAVPTVWSMLLQYLQGNKLDCGRLKEVVIGGAAVPVSMIQIFREQYGVNVVHAWGMTETSPIGTINRPCSDILKLSAEEQLAYACKQGRPVFGIELQLRDDDDNVLPQDGNTTGRLMIRGDWVLERYLGQEDKAIDSKGWFDTGDIATIDKLGYMQITDRAKDIIKSGGEWISSVELENAASGHPDVALAAVIGIPDPKWTERPMLLLKLREQVSPSDTLVAAILDFLSTQVSRWWLPEKVIFVEQIPLTATGKIDKKQLRKIYGV